ncbi:MAG TPA: 2-oxo acid dehydrogenase subunit E2, partial [Pyrinomonadaceae bacterium]
MSQDVNRQDLSEVIAESFGANATYVEGLLGRYRSDPALVDEAWRAYFAELLGDGNGASAPAANGGQAAAQPQAEAPAAAPAAPAQSAQTSSQAGATQAQAPAAAVQVRGEAQPIRGGALKIVENMETSLTVPTATSNRQVPVKVLEENRALVNQYLKEHKRGKASYTHFVAYAILRALERFPQM